MERIIAKYYIETPFDPEKAALINCAMLSINSVGLAGVKKICDQGALVIHGHRNGWGMLNRHPCWVFNLRPTKNFGASRA
ncbi:hypothetical protein M1D52_20200 [Olivibacter sp. SA151]|uniref:hypothetical protein n=1 Tax=Olivibacter jilunii TaxID=985016 RepID=UPI003F5CD417